jgi:Asp-tRNA(Asn)/Glu-tRNA(Gln) amidotransferase A subunit family amidase
VEDCAIVLNSIYGPDGQDLSVRDAAFNWDADFDWKSLRVGYFKSDFDAPERPKSIEAAPNETPAQKRKREARNASRQLYYAQSQCDWRFDTAALDKLRTLGVALIPVELPDLPYGAMTPLLDAEAAAAFDDLTLSGRDSLLTEQGAHDWPNVFRVARFYPAVQYIQANRARSLAIREVSKLFDQVDVIVTPTFSDQLTATNLTGHPALIVPNGLRGADAPKPSADGSNGDIGGPGTPVSITFLAGHYQDAKLCAFARAYQEATGFHKLHPRLD